MSTITAGGISITTCRTTGDSGRFSLNLGLRYELPGNNIGSLIDLNQRILDANNNNQVFALNPVPGTDKNNFEPRLGFAWSPTTSVRRRARMAHRRRPVRHARWIRADA